MVVEKKYYNANHLNDTPFELAQKFKQIIVNSNYRFIYNSIVGPMVNIENWMDEQRILDNIKSIQSEGQLLIKTLMLGESISLDDANHIFGDEGIRFLLQSNMFFLNQNTLIGNGYVLLPVNDLFLIVSLPSSYSNTKSKFSDIYIGQDSMRLQQMLINKHFHKVLDLCSGSGVQGLHYSKFSDEIRAVELNDNAVIAAILNAKINGCLNYKINKGDLYQELPKGTKFDCIISNPPYVPIPKDIEVAMCGDGGEDGMDIAKRIIDGYGEYLQPGGYAYMVLECVGDEDEPYILNYFRERLKTGEINVSIINKSTVIAQAAASAKLACGKDENSYSYYLEKWFDLFRRINATSIYAVTIEYKKTEEKWRENIIKVYNSVSLNQLLNFNEDIRFEHSLKEYYDLYKNKKRIFSIRKDLYEKLLKYQDRRIIDMIEDEGINPIKLVSDSSEMVNLLTLLIQYDAIKL